MEKTTLYLPRDMVLRLKEISVRTGRPRAELMRAALEDFLQQQGRPPLRSIGVGESETIQGDSAEEWLRENWRPR